MKFVKDLQVGDVFKLKSKRKFWKVGSIYDASHSSNLKNKRLIIAEFSCEQLIYNLDAEVDIKWTTNNYFYLVILHK